MLQHEENYIRERIELKANLIKSTFNDNFIVGELGKSINYFYFNWDSNKFFFAKKNLISACNFVIFEIIVGLESIKLVNNRFDISFEVFV